MRTMRVKLLIAICALLAGFAPQVRAGASGESFTVATYNLRYNNPNDGADAWPLRREAVKALIRFHAFDVFGTQEGLHDQIRDLAALDEYGQVGVGRDDGKQAGEHSAIFYRRDRFSVLRSGDFWLSETPDRPSLGWDATCCKRLASWAQLRDAASGRTFHVFSVHFDHQGVIARRESARLMLRRISEIAGSDPVICLGDFNSTPDSEPIVTLRGALRDARQVSLAPPYGPEATFNDFKWHVAPTARIDYIFVGRQFRVIRYGVLSDSRNQRYPSDHFPVVAQLVLE